jgi:hypothetical protein
MQPYDVLEDDARNRKKSSRKLLTASLGTTHQKQLKARGEQLNWDLVTALSEDPRGLPVPVSVTDGSVDGVLAAAVKVENRIPDGSTWDGKSDLPMDETTFRQMMSDVDPNSASAPAAPASQAPATPAGGETRPASDRSPPTTTVPVKPRPAGPPATSTAVSQSRSAVN